MTLVSLVVSRVSGAVLHVIWLVGFHDIGFTNPEMLPVSSNISALAKEGIILTNHLVHYHCSPTRR